MENKALVVISNSRLNRRSRVVIWNKTTNLNKSSIDVSEGLFQVTSQTSKAKLVIKTHNFNLH